MCEKCANLFYSLILDSKNRRTLKVWHLFLITLIALTRQLDWLPLRWSYLLKRGRLLKGLKNIRLIMLLCKRAAKQNRRRQQDATTTTTATVAATTTKARKTKTYLRCVSGEYNTGNEIAVCVLVMCLFLLASLYRRDSKVSSDLLVRRETRVEKIKRNKWRKSERWSCDTAKKTVTQLRAQVANSTSLNAIWSNQSSYIRRVLTLVAGEKMYHLKPFKLLVSLTCFCWWESRYKQNNHFSSVISRRGLAEKHIFEQPWQRYYKI